MDTVKVLCVENRVEYLEALKIMLEDAGYQVISATNGKQGVLMLRKNQIEGVLLEYDLPDATGAAVRAEMRRIKPEIPVLLFAGIGSQTPFLIRFFDSYLRNAEKSELTLQNFDA
ncbi:MAG TPA: response regulator [Candidatus Aquilonibacter sp.]|nr:response regulator [Candidatus Aquilonibacter sp.]